MVLDLETRILYDEEKLCQNDIKVKWMAHVMKCNFNQKARANKAAVKTARVDPKRALAFPDTQRDEQTFPLTMTWVEPIPLGIHMLLIVKVDVVPPVWSQV